MARIIPFKGVFYNPDKIHNLGDVTIPPYDVISKQEQLDFHNRHPYNIIRLTLGKQAENDTNKNNWHTRAAGFFNDWLSKNILVRDNSPSLYLTSVEFSSENKMITRYGLIALVGLEPFNKGIVIPHEKTFSKVTAPGVSLMSGCISIYLKYLSMPAKKRVRLSPIIVSSNKGQINCSTYIVKAARTPTVIVPAIT